MNNILGEAKKAAGGLENVWKNKKLSQEAKVGMLEVIVEPSLSHGSLRWFVCLRKMLKVFYGGLVMWRERKRIS